MTGASRPRATKRERLEDVLGRWEQMTDVEELTPSCVGLAEVFTDPETSSRHGNAKAAAEICHGCPFMQICDEYARLIKPTVGIWAGVRWGMHGATEITITNETENP